MHFYFLIVLIINFFSVCAMEQSKEDRLKKILINQTPNEALLSLKNENADLLYNLIDLGADINFSSKEQHYWTPFLKATVSGSMKILKILYAANANINAKNIRGRTALHIAAIRGYEEITKLLLEWGAYKDVIDRLGDTPLETAIKEEKFPIAALLLQHNAQIPSDNFKRLMDDSFEETKLFMKYLQTHHAQDINSGNLFKNNPDFQIIYDVIIKKNSDTFQQTKKRKYEELEI